MLYLVIILSVGSVDRAAESSHDKGRIDQRSALLLTWRRGSVTSNGAGKGASPPRRCTFPFSRLYLAVIVATKAMSTTSSRLIDQRSCLTCTWRGRSVTSDHAAESASTNDAFSA